VQRTLFDDDHDAYRSSVREFLARHARPHVEQYIEDKAIPREIWIEAGKQDLLGLEIPEEFGGVGADDYRFNAVLGEELSAVSAAFSSCFGIHYDVCAPYLVDLTTQEQKERWLPPLLLRRAGDGDRHDRAVGWLGPRRVEVHSRT
jgi:long-chain-acyl-CoA dehydrogenase